MINSSAAEVLAVSRAGQRVIKAVHGLRQVVPDPQFELDMAAHLRESLTSAQLREAFTRHVSGGGHIDQLMRRICLRALVKSLGSDVTIRNGVSVTHPETFEFGEGVHLGESCIIQGRVDGRCSIAKGVWIGPQCFLDARDLVIEEFVGVGPGVKVLGSEHTGIPTNIPLIQTDLEIVPVRIEAWADIGMNAVILPGVTIGRGALVGAGAVVTVDVPEFCTVAGVPAKVIGRRDNTTGSQVPSGIGSG